MRRIPQRDSLIEATYTLLASGTSLMLGKSLERAVLGHCSKTAQHFFPTETVSTTLQMMGMERSGFQVTPHILV